MTAVSKHRIHAKILATVEDAAVAYGPLEKVPFKLRLADTER